MTTIHPEQSERPSLPAQGPKASGLVVVGWLVLCFAILPLSMSLHGDGRIYTDLGLAMLVIGAIMIAVNRFGGPRRKTTGPSGVAG